MKEYNLNQANLKEGGNQAQIKLWSRKQPKPKSRQVFSWIVYSEGNWTKLLGQTMASMLPYSNIKLTMCIFYFCYIWYDGGLTEAFGNFKPGRFSILKIHLFKWHCSQESNKWLKDLGEIAIPMTEAHLKLKIKGVELV